MSPASYLTAPPRVASLMIAPDGCFGRVHAAICATKVIPPISGASSGTAFLHHPPVPPTRGVGKRYPLSETQNARKYIDFVPELRRAAKRVPGRLVASFA